MIFGVMRALPTMVRGSWPRVRRTSCESQTLTQVSCEKRMTLFREAVPLVRSGRNGISDEAWKRRRDRALRSRRVDHVGRCETETDNSVLATGGPTIGIVGVVGDSNWGKGRFREVFQQTRLGRQNKVLLAWR